MHMPALHLLAVVQLVANKTGLLFEIGSLQLQPLSHTHILPDLSCFPTCALRFLVLVERCNLAIFCVSSELWLGGDRVEEKLRNTELQGSGQWR